MPIIITTKRRKRSRGLLNQDVFSRNFVDVCSISIRTLFPQVVTGEKEVVASNEIPSKLYFRSSYLIMKWRMRIYLLHNSPADLLQSFGCGGFHFDSVDVHAPDGPVVAEVDPLGQPVIGSFPRPQIQSVGQVDYQGVKTFARLKVADFVVQSQSFGSAQSGHVKDVPEIQRPGVFRLAGHGQDVGDGHGESHGVHQGRTVAARDVGTEPDVDSAVHEPSSVAEPRAEGTVGIGAVRDAGAESVDNVDFLVREVHAVSQNGLGREQAGLAVDVDVIPAAGVDVLCGLAFGRILRDVRLQFGFLTANR